MTLIQLYEMVLTYFRTDTDVEPEEAAVHNTAIQSIYMMNCFYTSDFKVQIVKVWIYTGNIKCNQRTLGPWQGFMLS